MPGLVPAIHALLRGTKNVEPGTSPGMTSGCGCTYISSNRLGRADLARQDDGGCDREQTKTSEGVQHGDEAALLVEPRDQADRGAGRGEADEIAHGIGARAPF